MPNVMEERLAAAAERNAEAEQPAQPPARRPTPMLNVPRPSANVVGALIVGAAFLAIFAASLWGGAAPAETTRESGSFPSAAPAAPSPAPAAEQERVSAPVEVPTAALFDHGQNPTPAPLPTGENYLIGTDPAPPPPPQLAPAAPPVIYSELVPIVEEEDNKGSMPKPCTHPRCQP